MAEKLDLSKITMISHMKAETFQQICDILDIDNTWETIAPYMPGIQLRDVEGCKKYASFSQSPSKMLLQVWCAKGYTTNHLFQLFAKTKLIRLMRIIKPEVDEKYHYLEAKVINSTSRIPKPNSAPPASQSASKLKKSGPKESSPAPTQASSSTPHDPLNMAIKGTLPVSYPEILEATENFAQHLVIGRGGYGVVYKGELKSTGGFVAIKRLNAGNETHPNGSKVQMERMKQSLTELRTLGRFRHDNILPIYAHCMEGPEPCLVYQYMSNGSLEDRILCRFQKGSPPLTWDQRREISIGSARGIHFLHSVAKIPIIHGDIKTANILLDKHMEPKIGDFGLSRDGQMETEAVEKGPLIASHVKGTLAYLPPEFMTSRILTTKLDVYSYGIVLMEIASGLRAYIDNRDPRGLVEYCKKHNEMAKSQKVPARELLIDKRAPPLESEAQHEFLEILIQVGLMATVKDRTLRPSMREIINALCKCELPEIKAATPP